MDTQVEPSLQHSAAPRLHKGQLKPCCPVAITQAASQCRKKDTPTNAPLGAGMNLLLTVDQLEHA